MNVTIRPVTEDDEPQLEAWGTDLGPYADWGDRTGGPRVEVLGRMLVLEDGTPVGDLSWHAEAYGPNAGSVALNIGIDLAADARGRGLGTVAQRLLAAHLFATTGVHRVEASTDVTNDAEQRALEKAGFAREGVLRGAQYRGDGIHHDLVSYAILRTDLE
ncbi:MAG TPA: GNAT family protein [Candidatus Limnocylindria bacterium]|nr:GNAT family protein [Candidatus Limnocylindria bacterium]